MSDEIMLDENKCVQSATQYIEQEGYANIRIAKTTETGIDIEATAPSGE
jgi:hypothetical protein